MATIIAGNDSYATFATWLLTGTAAADLSLKIANEELEAATIGETWKDFRQGRAEATFDASGVWDAGTATDRLDAVLYASANKGGTKLMEYMPEGSATNRIKYTFNAFTKAYEISSPVAGVVGFTLSCRVAGSVTRSLVT